MGVGSLLYIFLYMPDGLLGLPPLRRGGSWTGGSGASSFSGAAPGASSEGGRTSTSTLNPLVPSISPFEIFSAISLCCLFIMSRTMSLMFGLPRWSPYESFFDAMMLPSTKTWVMMWGWDLPESSVWM
jgi:hypothetical protein